MVTINSDGYTDPIQETRGGTNQSSFTQGDILYASGANTLSKLAKNTSTTTVLTNTGASNNPAWAQVSLTTGVSGILPVANGGTNLSLISTQTASSAASIAWTSGISASFNNYLIVLTDVVPSVNGVNLGIQYSTNGGSSYVASGYASFVWCDFTGTTFHAVATTSTTTGQIAHSTNYGTSTPGASGIIELYNLPFVNSHGATFVSNLIHANSGVADKHASWGLMGNAAAINAIKVLPASGTITGILSLYTISN